MGMYGLFKYALLNEYGLQPNMYGYGGGGIDGTVIDAAKGMFEPTVPDWITHPIDLSPSNIGTGERFDTKRDEAKRKYPNEYKKGVDFANNTSNRSDEPENIWVAQGQNAYGSDLGSTGIARYYASGGPKSPKERVQHLAGRSVPNKDPEDFLKELSYITGVQDRGTGDYRQLNYDLARDEAEINAAGLGASTVLSINPVGRYVINPLSNAFSDKDWGDVWGMGKEQSLQAYIENQAAQGKTKDQILDSIRGLMVANAGINIALDIPTMLAWNRIGGNLNELSSLVSYAHPTAGRVFAIGSNTAKAAGTTASVGKAISLGAGVADASGLDPNLVSKGMHATGDFLQQAPAFAAVAGTLSTVPFVGKAVTWLNAPGSTVAGTIAKQPLKWIGNDVMAGTVTRILQEGEEALTGEEIPDKAHPLGLVLPEYVKAIDHGIFDHNETLGALRYGGLSDKIMEEKLNKAMDAMGVPRDNQQVREALEQSYAELRWIKQEKLALNDVIAGYEKMTPQQQQEALAALPKEKLGEALRKQYIRTAVKGGRMDPRMFADPRLTPEQQREALTTYVTACKAGDMTSGGFADIMSELKRLTTEKGYKAHVLTEMMQRNPHVKAAVAAHLSSEVARAFGDPSAASSKMSEADLEMLDACLGGLSDKERTELFYGKYIGDDGKPVTYGALATQTAADTVASLTGASGNAAANNPRLRKAYMQALGQRMQDDGEYMAEFIPAYKAAATSVPMSEEDGKVLSQVLNNFDPNKSFNSMSDKTFIGLAKFILSDEGKKWLESFGDEGSGKLKQKFIEAAKTRMWAAVKSDPIANLPMAMSLWMRSKGWDNVAEMAENPVAFWAIAALLLGGGLFLGASLFDSSDDDDQKENKQVQDASMPSITDPSASYVSIL